MFQKLEGLIDGRKKSPQYMAERKLVYTYIFVCAFVCICEYTCLAKMT